MTDSLHIQVNGRPEITPVEVMSLRIMGMVAVAGTVFTADQLLEHLHGRTTPEEQDLVIDALRTGFSHHSVRTSQISFARLCVELGNFELLERVVREGPPQIRRFEKLSDSPAAWLDWLCSVTDTHSPYNGVAPGNGFDTVLQSLRPDSVKLLRLAYELDPNHRCLLQEAQGCTPVRDEQNYPGNFHYAMLHLALNGATSTSTVHSQAGKREPYKLHDHPRGHEIHATALECLAFLRSVGNVPFFGEKMPLDAWTFVTAFNLGSRYDDIRALMTAYRETGALDIDDCIHPARRTYGGDIPIDTAIHCGSAGAAAALIDMGCNLDPKVVAQAYGGDLLKLAEAANRPHVTAVVIEALMRRRLASAASPAAEAPPPRRRRLATL